jgi:hypothetical protein
VNVTAMTVTLKANRKSIAEAVITESSKLSFNSLQAGMLVDAIIGSPATVIFVDHHPIPFLTVYRMV